MGVSYTNPLIIKEPNYSLASNLNLTFGIRFNSGGWANIGRGLAVVGTAGLAVANAYYGNVSDNTGGTAYSQYDSMAGHSGSASTYIRNQKLLKDAQREMQKYRQQAARNGLTIPISEWETKKIKSN